jgi:hypothetical protein
MNASQPSSSSRLATILGVGALLFLAFAFAFGQRLLWFGAEAPLPELMQGLPDSKTEADQELYLGRLRAAFPPGSAESELAAALRRQGFKLGAAAERAASYDRQAGIADKCRRSGNVRWTADAEGRVTAIAGGYYQHCP